MLQTKTNLTIEQKAQRFNGKDHWHLQHGNVTFSDGPNGLRIEDESGYGFVHSKEARLYPTACAIGNSFDKELLYQYGQYLAEECIEADVDVLLGPGINTKRSPLCGRNFEYYSEDPLLSGEYGQNFINGLQERGIGCSLKHYAVNNREYARLIYNCTVDQRALYEIYLRQYKIAIEKSHPFTIMPAYNKLNGSYCCENKALLQQARDWGFDGVFISDWGAISNPIKAIQAGLNLEMPGNNHTDQVLLQAIQNKQLDSNLLEQSDTYIETLIDKCQHKEQEQFTTIQRDDFIERASEESIVLLKNEGILPLNKTTKIHIVGPYAKHPNVQGAGSSFVNDPHCDSFMEVCKQQQISYTYDPFYHVTTHEEKADVVIVFVGDEENDYGEGFDRKDLKLDEKQVSYIEKLKEVQKNIIVVLQTGTPVLLPFKEDVQAIVCEYLNGSKSGLSLMKVLFGECNPSGHLAETWPIKEDDVPCANYFNNSMKEIQYRESIFVGYRYYDTYNIPVNYPFGYGLSYSKYEYQLFKVQEKKNEIILDVQVKNIGKYDGRCVIQVYAGMKQSKIVRAKKELVGFESIFLKQNEQKTIEVSIPKDNLCYYDIKQQKFLVEEGIYTFMIGENVEEMICCQDCYVEGEKEPYSSIPSNYMNDGIVTDETYQQVLQHDLPTNKPIKPFNQDTTLEELKSCKLGRFFMFVFTVLGKFGLFQGIDEQSILTSPIRQVLWANDQVGWTTVQECVAFMNHHSLKHLLAIMYSLRKNR